MVTAQLNANTSSNPLLDIAWAILEAADHLRDVATVDSRAVG